MFSPQGASLTLSHWVGAPTVPGLSGASPVQPGLSLSPPVDWEPLEGGTGTAWVSAVSPAPPSSGVGTEQALGTCGMIGS